MRRLSVFELIAAPIRQVSRLLAAPNGLSLLTSFFFACAFFAHSTASHAKADCGAEAMAHAQRSVAAVDTWEAQLLASLMYRWGDVFERPIEPGIESSFEHLAKAQRLAPDYEPILFALALECPRGATDAAYRCQRAYALRLLHLDEGNGWYWSMLAPAQHYFGETQAAFESIGRAIDAPYFSTLWGKQAALFSEALGTVPAVTEACAFALASELASRNQPSFDVLETFCRSRFEEEDWRHACLNLGEAMEMKGAPIYGFWLQRIALEAGGDSEALDVVLRRRQRFERDSDKFLVDSFCLNRNPAEKRRWLANMTIFPDREALEVARSRTPECKD